MSVNRIFLDWNAPLTHSVREFLLPQDLSGPVNLGRDLIVVPTRQAGRRLRESLAQYCAQHNTALLSTRIVIPTFFLRPEEETTDVASPTEVSAIWADLLSRADLSQLTGLFSARSPRQDFSWAMSTGKMIQKLRDTLADGGLQIENVHRDFIEALEEPQRWLDLAILERSYLDRLEGLGKQDPVERMIRQAETPHMPSGVDRIIIAGVPDPTPLMIRALEQLASQYPITILIHAPQTLAAHFDSWGRPIPEMWRDVFIDVPDPEANILLADSPTSQSRRVMETIAAEASRFGPSDIAIGVPDTGITPYLAAELDAHDLSPFDPAGKPLTQHPLFQLLDAFHLLISEGGYTALSTVLRHSAVLERLALPTDRLLEELDRFQNDHLPLGWDAMAEYFAQTNQTGEYDTLAKAVVFLSERLAAFAQSDIDSAIRGLLQIVYENHTIDPENPEDILFAQVAELVDAALRELDTDTIGTLGLEQTQAFRLLLIRLSEQRHALEQAGSLVDLEGWLELPWNDAPLLVVTGMNEGIVPARRREDSFLTDPLRTRLGLPGDGERMAVDTYLMQELMQSRRAQGRSCFIVGKTSATGDPLKPSRLLFRCPDEELTRRAERLFGDVPKERSDPPPTVSFRLKIEAEGQPVLTRLSVTQLKDYLACPFRFYLKHILKMAAMDDRKTEMDAMDFGSMVHHALHRMAQNPKMTVCENEWELGRFLSEQAALWATDQFGHRPPLQIEIQLLSAQERLLAAAREQVQLIAEGWEIIAAERRVELSLGDIKISGRVDRIDRHRETGQIRIIDYKTSEKAAKPEAVHLLPKSSDAPDYARVFIGDKKEKRWGDLQLPLYQLMLAGQFDGSIRLGYFNLPKAATETGLVLWEGISQTLLDSARACAEGIAKDITEGRFWPPAAKVLYDEFAHLFPADIEDCVEFIP